MTETESTTSSCSATRSARGDCKLIDLTNPEIVSAIMHKAGHEIGNPLTSIISLASIISRFSSGLGTAATIENKSAQYANSISSEAWKISRLSDTLVMLFSKQQGSPSKCSVAEILERSLNKLKTRANIDTDSVIARFVQEESPVAYIDSEQLIAVLSELIANAIQASSQISNTRKDSTANNPIVVSAQQFPEGTVIEVRNVVAERNPLEIKSLFLPLVTTSQAQKNMGLGLSMAAIVAERFNGFVEIEEKPFGSDSSLEFIARIVLPSSGESRVENINLALSNLQRTDVVSTRNISAESPLSLKVLVIEDQPVVASAIRKILEFYYRGKTTIEFSHLNGRDAIKSIEDGAHYQAILCDLNLDGINGKDVYSVIKRSQPSLCSHFAYMTGGLPPQDGDSNIPCLSKPFEPEQLLNLVQKLFAK